MAESIHSEVEYQLGLNQQSHFIPYSEAIEQLVPIVTELSLARDLKTVMAIIRRAVRKLTGADGANFVLPDEDLCFYADEKAMVSPRRGRKLNMESCISGWAMLNKEPVVIEDVSTDERIPQGVFDPALVKSLVMVPISQSSPIGAIGAYWARKCSPPPEVVKILQSLAELASSSMRSIGLYEEMRKTKEALEKSEGLLREVVDSMPVGVWITGERGNIAIVNQMAQSIWKGNKDDGMDRFDAYKGWWANSGKRLESHEWALARAIRNGETSLDEVIEIECFDGERKTILSSAVPVRSKDGRVVAGIAISQDITERKQAEKELLQAKREWELTFDSVPDLMAILDTNHRIVRANAKMRERLGVTPDQCSGLHCFEVVHCSSQPPGFCPHSKTLIDGREHVAEVHEDRLGGDFLISTTPLRDEQGVLVGTVHVARDITERKRMEEALRKSEERFRTLADNMSQFSWMADENGWVFWYNKRWYDYTGTTLEEMQGWGWKRVLHPEHVDRVVERIQHSWDTGKPWEDIFPLRGKEGEYRWFLSRALPIRDESGRIVQWFGTNTDITEHREAERALGESERQFRELAEALPEIVWFTGPDGYVEYFNERWSEFTGLSLEESRGELWARALHPDDHKRVLKHWHQSLEAGEPYQVEYRFRRAGDGAYYWFLARGLPVRDEQGRIVRWFGTCTYIHDMKLAEEALRRAHDELEFRVRERTAELQKAYDALRQSEEKYRELVQNANSIILRMDSGGQITFFNEFAQDFFGYREEEILGRHVIGTIVPKTLSSGHDLAACMEGIVRRPEQCEYLEGEVIKRNGERAWVSWTNKAIHDEGGALSGLLSIGSDITEHRRAEERLRVYTAKLEQQNRELEDFTFISSHHVQEPLRKIVTFSDKLETRCRDMLDPQAEDYIHRMHKSVERIQALIRDLLRYSRISSETEGFAPVDLSRVVRTVLSDLAPSIEETRAHVELFDLPTIDADRKHMRNLFTHLIENAIKFCGENAPVIKIDGRRKSLRGKEFVDIFVVDNGIGFDEKYLGRIFTPFQQLHGKGRYEGTGMGLAICRRIVELHGGSITSESAPGEGATFIVTLPVHQERRGEPL